MVQSGSNNPVVHATTPIDPARQQRRSWDDAPLRTKTVLLIFLAAVGGVFVGMIEAHLDHRIWPLSMGLAGLCLGLIWLGRHWVWGPFDKLLDSWRRLAIHRGPGALRSLPMTRQDEVGQLSRAMYQLTSTSIRDNLEARHLRRTLDHRIQQATRAATSQLRQMAMRDSLTDLGNRRFLDDHLEPLVASVKASGSRLAAMMIDMDNFKQINDTQGHSVGDEMLVFLASLLRATIRRDDYAVRMGGDEFLLLLPDCDRQRLKDLSDHLVLLFRQHVRTALPADCQTSLSIGVAILPGAGVTTARELLDAADANLYAAKRAGKDQIHGA